MEAGPLEAGDMPRRGHGHRRRGLPVGRLPVQRGAGAGRRDLRGHQRRRAGRPRGRGAQGRSRGQVALPGAGEGRPGRAGGLPLEVGRQVPLHQRGAEPVPDGHRRRLGARRQGQRRRPGRARVGGAHREAVRLPRHCDPAELPREPDVVPQAAPRHLRRGAEGRHQLHLLLREVHGHRVLLAGVQPAGADADHCGQALQIRGMRRGLCGLQDVQVDAQRKRHVLQR
mmetsp:Transcript_63350/g.164628  ORF Transcript_63350/g.164628 Transcript_63350/m.164628 type:complete len:227 (-) Transcript_63350:283-963(-)